MLVKICGIKNTETAHVAINAGADLLGFVFAPSKRQVTPNEAANITKSLPSFIKKVGIFVNETVNYMNDVAQQVGLDYIQLHGDEPAELLKELSCKVIKAIPIDRLNDDHYSFVSDYYLLDSPSREYRGGSGETFDWNLATDLSIDPKKIFLAGGLTPENIQTAIKKVKPIGVDVSSGVETKGEKDYNKIKQFITNAKG